VIPLLAKSSNEYVLADVAWSRRTPEAILRDLARHDHHLIRWALAGNPATPTRHPRGAGQETTM